MADAKMSIRIKESWAYLQNMHCSSQLYNKLNSFRLHDQFCDGFLEVHETLYEGCKLFNRYPIHSCILSAWSSTFENMFSKFGTSTERVVDLTGYSSKLVAKIVDYMYGQEIYSTYEGLDGLKLIAEDLQIDCLVVHCETAADTMRHDMLLRVMPKPRNSWKKSAESSSAVLGTEHSYSASRVKEQGTQVEVIVGDNGFEIKEEPKELENDEELVFEDDVDVPLKNDPLVNGSDSHDIKNAVDEDDHDIDYALGMYSISDSGDYEEVDEFPNENEAETVSSSNTCDHCNRVFANARSLYKHKLRVKKANDPNSLRLLGKRKYEDLTCDHCNQVFKNADTFRMHKKRVEQAKDPFAPSLIGVFKAPEHVRKKQRIASRLRREKLKSGKKEVVEYHCDVCNEKFPGLQKMRKHRIAEHGPKTYACHICAHTFSTNSILQRHIKRHNKQKDAKCEHCDFCAVTKYEVADHAERVHSDIRYPCSKCATTFSTRQACRKHEQSHDAERVDIKLLSKLLLCQVCGKGFVNQLTLDRHIDSKHVQNVDGGDESIQSPVKKTKKKRVLREPGELNFLKEKKPKAPAEKQCPICKRNFKHPHDMRRHLKRHSGQKNHECRYCDYRSYYAHEMKYHQEAMHLNNAYECPLCNQVFKTKHHLAKHKRLGHHVYRERLYCPQCNFSTPIQNRLDGHMKNKHGPNANLPKRLFGCGICDKQLTSEFNLNRHMKCVHQIIPPSQASSGLTKSQKLLERAKKVATKQRGKQKLNVVRPGGKWGPQNGQSVVQTQPNTSRPTQGKIMNYNRSPQRSRGGKWGSYQEYTPRISEEDEEVLYQVETVLAPQQISNQVNYIQNAGEIVYFEDGNYTLTNVEHV